MNIDSFEIWVHDHILKNATIRHFAYGLYQRAMYIASPKLKSEGDIVQITPNDDFEYLFGYYDKCPWSKNGQYLLALKVKNAYSSADSKTLADIVRIDLYDNNKVEMLAHTHCWNVQQGCMAQWIGKNSIIYNDFRNGKYCAVVLDLSTKKERIIGRPIYALSVDEKIGLSLDFSRLHRLRPGYGYSNIPDETAKEKCPDKTCIWKIDIETGKIVELLKYTDFSNFEHRPEMEEAEHKVNHIMISPDGNRFMVLHRWIKSNQKYTRLVTCNVDGTELYNLSDDNFVSHCFWKNNSEIVSYLNKVEYGKGYYLLYDKSKKFEPCWEELSMDGHPSYSYDGRFVITDTYPNRRRIQSLYLMEGSKVRQVARVFSPFKYNGDTRCDLHPRWSRDGMSICFDGSFTGKREIYILSVKEYAESRKIICDNRQFPVISVIIPCYNCEKTIDETLEALENQTYKNFEVLCVNDGSTDRTRNILQKWKDKGTFCLRIIDQPNGGVSSARNKGIAECKGKYIVFCDSDDLYHECFLELLLSAIESSGADVAYCRLSRDREEVKNYIPRGGIV